MPGGSTFRLRWWRAGARAGASTDEERFPAPAVDAYRLELEAFAAAARGQAEPAPTLAESVVTAFTVDALLASGRDLTAVTVEIPEAVLA